MNNSIIEHRANYHYIQVCEEYLLICSHGKASPHCKALILSVLEQWTNTKRDTKQPLDSIYMTYPLWEQSLYYLYSRSTIIECLGELEEEKKISRKVHRLHGKDTFVYALNTGLIQGLIKALPDKGTKELLPHLDAFKNRRVQKQTRPEVNGLPVQKQTGNASKIKRNVSSNISSSTTSEDTYDADASRTLADFSLEEIAAYLAAHTNQPELSTPIVDKSSTDPVATSNPIASDTPQPTHNENGSHEQPASGKKPRSAAQPLDDTTKARVERVFSYFDKLKQEMTGDPEAKYVRTKTAIGEIKDTLLPCAPTEQRLRKVYMALWNTPRDARSGFEWKKNMTIKAVCGQYEARVIDIIAEEKQEAAKKHEREQYMLPTTPIAPDEEELPFDINRVRANRRRFGNRQVV